MSEKRFDLLLPNAIMNDTVKRKSYYLDEKEDVERIVGLLNHLHQELIAQKSLANYYRQKYKECEKIVDIELIERV